MKISFFDLMMISVVGIAFGGVIRSLAVAGHWNLGLCILAIFFGALTIAGLAWLCRGKVFDNGPKS